MSSNEDGIGSETVRAHQRLRSLYEHHKSTITSTWPNLSRSERQKLVLDSSAAGEQSFLRTRHDPRPELVGARNMTPELNLQDLAENEYHLLNLLELRAYEGLLQQFPGDAEFIKQAMAERRLGDATARKNAFMMFLGAGVNEYGRVMEVTQGSPWNTMNDALRIGRGMIQNEETGILILTRQLIIYLGLTAIIDAIVQGLPHSTTRTGEATSTRSPSTPKLINQPSPPYQSPNFEGPMTFKFPAINPEDANRQRRFIPDRPNATPFDLFEVKWNICTVPGVRFIRKDNRKQMLMFIDGACLNNQNQSISRGGSGIVYTCLEAGAPIKQPLNRDGHPHTNNRAELLAAILPLGMRYWPGEGFNNIVLACDSEYVVKGITEWLPTWIARGWKTSAGKPVKNRDLWEKLVETLRGQEKKGILVQFWQIPRDLNEADPYAKMAATMEGDEGETPTEMILLQT